MLLWNLQYRQPVADFAAQIFRFSSLGFPLFTFHRKLWYTPSIKYGFSTNRIQPSLRRTGKADTIFCEVLQMTEKEKSYAGLLYQPADPELAADRDVTAKKLYDYNQLHPLDREARQAAIRAPVWTNCRSHRDNCSPSSSRASPRHAFRQAFRCRTTWVYKS